MADTKITIISTIRSGKTSYLAGMYDRLNFGLGDFTLRAKDPVLPQF